MKSWYLWVGLALFVLVLLSIREGFVATATITNPNTWNAAELTRIKGLVTSKATYGSDVKTAVNALTDAEIREVVGGFWSYSVPSALPNEPATPKGWSVAETQITSSDVTEYMNGIVRATPGYANKRAAFSALLTEYYITQGQSTFQTARAARWGGSESTEGATTPSPPDTSASTPTEIERPATSTQSLRQEIATTFGITTSQTAAIDFVIGKVQSFYDTVYLPAKTTPTYTAITGFADGVDTATVPSSIRNNFKVHMIEVLETYFTPQSGASGVPGTRSVTSGAMAGSDAGSGDVASGWASAKGKNVQGPDSGGRGTDNTTGGLGIPRNYPVLYGGMQEYESALPSSSSLGTDPTSKFLPYSRVPGDMDLYPDPYRLGKYFSTSSYSSGKDAPEPAPFLADFSKFFT